MKVICPACSASLNAPDTFTGGKVKCPKCQTVSMMTPPATPAPAAKPAVVARKPAPVVVDEPAEVDEAVDDAPPPKKKRRVDDDADEKPKPKRKKPAVVVDDEDDDRPKAKRRREGGEDERPKGKKKGKAAKKSNLPLLLGVGGGAVVLLVGAGLAIGFATNWGQPQAKSPDTGTVTRVTVKAQPLPPDEPGGPRPPSKPLRTLAVKDQLKLKGTLPALAVSPDGKTLLAGGSLFSDLVVVKAEGGLAETGRGASPAGGATQIAVLRDNSRGIAFSSAALGGDKPGEQYLFTLDAPELKAVATYAGKEIPYSSGVVPGTYRFVKQTAAGLSLCEVETGKVVQAFDPPPERTLLTVSPDGKWACGYHNLLDTDLHIWDCGTGKLAKSITDKKRWRVARFGPAGDLFVFERDSLELKVYAAGTWAAKGSVKPTGFTRDTAPDHLGVSADGRHVVLDQPRLGKVKVYETETLQLVGEATLPKFPAAAGGRAMYVHDLAVAPTGSRVYAICQDDRSESLLVAMDLADLDK